jgi:hypothetical protein
MPIGAKVIPMMGEFVRVSPYAHVSHAVVVKSKAPRIKAANESENSAKGILAGNLQISRSERKNS